MNTSEFLSLMQSKKATIFSPSSASDIAIANTNLQEIRAAIMPVNLQDFYLHCSAITLGPACIFGPKQIERGIKYPLPSIIQINKDLNGNKNLYGKTIFGRNDLFLFAFDTMGNYFMLDNITLSVLRKYDDVYRIMMDCLIVGKI